MKLVHQQNLAHYNENELGDIETDPVATLSSFFPLRVFFFMGGHDLRFSYLVKFLNSSDYVNLHYVGLSMTAESKIISLTL